MANNASKLSTVDAEKADRAAASIRPSWDFEHADFEAAAASPDRAEPFEKKLSREEPAKGAVTPTPAAKTPVPFSAGADIPRDTVIDGVPTVAVGRTIDIGPAPDEVNAKPERAPRPAKPQATRFGLGGDPEPPSAPPITSNGTQILPATTGAQAAAAAAAEALPLPPKRIDATEAFAPGDVAEVAPLESPPVHSSAPPPAPHADERPLATSAPMGASISRIEDPIEIPRKSSGPILWIVGGAVAVAAIVGGIVLFSGGDAKTSGAPTATSTAQTKPAATTEKPTTTTTAAAAPTTPAAPQTATASAAPTPSAAPSETVAATSEPAPSAKPAVTTKPTAVAATTPPTKPTGTPKTPPPKGSSGGIRRDTPF
ncbi:MAG: hypothetical protein U0414_34635 [Polyangiaceae bacterium]